MIKNVVVIGRGAVGAVYATTLHDAMGAEHFRVALDAERLERYEREEFEFNGKPYKFNYFTPKEGDKAVDLIIIATKWGGYAAALDTIAPLVGEQTLILPLLNGLIAHDSAVERFGAHRVLRGFYIGHTASRKEENGASGAVQDGSYKTNFGDDINVEPYSPRVLKIKELFDRTGIKYRIPENMVTAQWQKFVINIGSNQPTGLYRQSYGEMTSDERSMELSIALMNEAQALAVKLGVQGADELITNALNMFKTLYAGDYSSMAQDTRAGRPTEVEIFAGHVMKMGRELGVPTPRNEAFMRELLGRTV